MPTLAELQEQAAEAEEPDGPVPPRGELKVAHPLLHAGRLVREGEAVPESIGDEDLEQLYRQGAVA